jgi:hypothetical protein
MGLGVVSDVELGVEVSLIELVVPVHDVEVRVSLIELVVSVHVDDVSVSDSVD